MLTSVVLGTSIAIAAGGIASYRMISHAPHYAQVRSAKLVAERGEAPRPECRDIAVTRPKPVKDVSERTIGYEVAYRIGDQPGRVRMDRDPGPTIPVRARPARAGRARRLNLGSSRA